MPNKAGLCCLLSHCHGGPALSEPSVGQRRLTASIGLCEGFEARIRPLVCKTAWGQRELFASQGCVRVCGFRAGRVRVCVKVCLCVPEATVCSLSHLAPSRSSGTDVQT